MEGTIPLLEHLPANQRASNTPLSVAVICGRDAGLTVEDDAVTLLAAKERCAADGICAADVTAALTHEVYGKVRETMNLFLLFALAECPVLTYDLWSFRPMLTQVCGPSRRRAGMATWRCSLGI